MSCSSVKPSFCLVIEVFLGQHVGLPCFELIFQLSKPLTITRLSRSAAHSQTAQTSLMLKKGKPPNLSMKKLKSCSLNFRLCRRFSADIGSDASQLICLIHLALQFHIHFKQSVKVEFYWNYGSCNSGFEKQEQQEVTLCLKLLAFCRSLCSNTCSWVHLLASVVTYLLIKSDMSMTPRRINSLNICTFLHFTPVIHSSCTLTEPCPASLRLFKVWSGLRVTLDRSGFGPTTSMDFHPYCHLCVLLPVILTHMCAGTR